MLTELLRKAVSEGVPLVELVANTKAGVSPEVVCEAVNHLSDQVISYSYDSLKVNRVITIQAHPSFLRNLGIVIYRVPVLDTEEFKKEPGYPRKWFADDFGPLERKLEPFIESITLSQPGAYDEGGDSSSESMPFTLFSLPKPFSRLFADARE